MINLLSIKGTHRRFGFIFSTTETDRKWGKYTPETVFAFTGKELDEETGYSYFGARFYAPATLAAWLSVDPMSDKYPSISPYAYCAWNPLKLVDPEGEDVWEVDDKGNVTKKSDEGGANKQTINYANGTTKIYKGKYYQSIMSNLSLSSKYDGTISDGNAMANVFLDMSDNTEVEWEMAREKSGVFLLMTQHEEGHSGTLTDDIVSVIHSHPNANANKIDEEGSLGIKHDSKGNRISIFSPSDASIVGYGKRNINYFVYMKKSHNVWQISKPKPGGVSFNCLGTKNSAQQILNLLTK